MKTCCPSSLLYEDRRKKIVFRENRSKYIGINKSDKTIEAYKIDGKIDTGGAKCDFGIIIRSDNDFYLIELKGRDLSHACTQIEETMNFLKKNGINMTYRARIVLSKVSAPELESSQYKKLSRLIKKNGGDLKQQTLELPDLI